MLWAQLFQITAAESRNDADAQTMKAVRIHAFGGIDALKYEAVPIPQPKEDEILIRVIAAGVNPYDVDLREGADKRLTFPLTLGLDVSGIVEKTGAKVTKFKKGDAVYAFLDYLQEGGYAEFAITKENWVSAKPKSLGHQQAASLPVAASTAWLAVVETANLSAGQTILIHGGSGGVGSLAIQIAKARGAKVFATASASNQELLRQLGADQTIDYAATKFEDVVKDVDVVIDSVGGDTLRRSYGIAKKGGIVVSLVANVDKAALSARGIRGTTIIVRPDSSRLAEITQLIAAGNLKPMVTQVFPLSDAAKAQEAAATHHTRGKIVLQVSDEPKSN
jgi:NADPH:quinone reductase-like Zn-dependent oxidoreductase